MDEVREVRFMPDGRTIASTSADKAFRLWQTTGGKETRFIALEKQPQAMSLFGSIVASRGPREPTKIGIGVPVREEIVELCDTATGQVRQRLKHDHHVDHVALSPDGALVAVSTENGPVHLWDAATGKLLRQWAASAPLSMAFSSGGKTLATGDRDSTVKLWEVANGRFIRNFGMPRDQSLENENWVSYVSCIAFSPNGKLMATVTSSRNVCTVWDVASGKQLYQCEVLSDWTNNGMIYAVAFSPDGKTLITGGEDRSIHLWDAATGQKFSRLQGHRGAVRSLAVSPDGARLASGSRDGTILIWDLASSAK